MATQVMSITDFMSGDYKRKKPVIKIVAEHLDRNRIAYTVAGIGVTMVLTGGVDHTLAAGLGSLDAKAEAMYKKLLEIAKWVIVVKGSFDSITDLFNNDFQSAKKKIIQYGLMYLLLRGLPWLLKLVDEWFA